MLMSLTAANSSFAAVPGLLSKGLEPGMEAA